MTNNKSQLDWNAGIEAIIVVAVGSLLLFGRSLISPTSYDEVTTNFIQTIQKRIGMDVDGKCSSTCDKITNRCTMSCSTDFVKKGDPECPTNACIASDGLCYDMPPQALGCAKQINGKTYMFGVICPEVTTLYPGSKKIRCVTHLQWAYETAQYQNRQTTVRQTTTNNNQDNSSSYFCKTQMEKYNKDLWDYNYCEAERKKDGYSGLCNKPRKPIGCD